MEYTCSHSSALYSQHGTYICRETTTTLSIKIILHMCVCVWNKTKNVRDSHTAITEDSSLQGLGQALQFFNTLATTCPTQHHTQQT